MLSARSLTRLALSGALIALLPACGILGIGGGNDSDGDDGNGDTDTVTENRAPTFLDFSVNTSVATDTDNLVFTALVTDPDGIDDLIGGSLKAPGGASYGSFATSSAEGSYQITLTWNDLNTVSAIDIDGSPESREFVAEFFDAAGNNSTRSVTIRLECAGGDDEATCDGDGRCISLLTATDCLECGNNCTDTGGINVGSGSFTQRGQCEPSAGGCTASVVRAAQPGLTCDAVCGDWDCADGSFGGMSIGCSTPSSADVLHCDCEK